MELGNYNNYRKSYPHKTDAQIIESLVWELKDKVQAIHRLLDKVAELEKQKCDCEDYENGFVSMYCPIHNVNPYTSE